MKKLNALLVSLALMLAMVAPAFAANDLPLAIAADPANAQAAIKAAGGTPGKINVRLNDKCIAFPDAFPEVLNGTTMIPLRALVETMGAKVETPTDGIVTISIDKTVITLQIGDKAVTVQKDGADKQTLTLAVAPYIKSDRTYVPLRFVSEVFGYDVLWDQAYQTAVILDGKAIVADIDKDFTTLNAYFKNQSKYLTGNWKSEGTMEISLDLIDAVNGNQSFTIPGKMTSHTGGSVANIECSVDLSGMVTSLGKLAGDDQTTAMLLQAIGKSQSMSIRVLPDGSVYLKSALFDMLTSQLGVATAGKDVWYLLSKIDPTVLKAENFTMGNVYYSSVLESSKKIGGAFYAYDVISQSKQMMKTVMGDASFQKQGDNYVWTLDKAKLTAMTGSKEAADLFQELNLKLTFNLNGTYSMTGSIKIDIADWNAALTMNANGNGASDAMNMELLLKDMFNLKIKSSSKTWEVKDAPQATLPQGATVVDLLELLTKLG